MRNRVVKPHRARPAKLKSVTFTGCWTCRSRKVKCDERQTDGCGVCEKAGLECAGYGLNLCWVTGQKQDFHGLRRRNIKPVHFSAPMMSDVEINETLAAIDTILVPSDTVVQGPFAIFQSCSSNVSDNISRSPISWSSDPEEPMIPDEEVMRIVTEAEFDVDKAETNQHAYPTTLQPMQDICFDITDFGNNGCIDEIIGAPEPPSSSRPLGEPGVELGIVISANPKISNTSLLHPRPSIPLLQDGQTSMLMCHYMDHVTELLQPVLHPRNPWKTTYVPFALSARSDLFLCQSNSMSTSYASIALFHSILSAAAFHLRNASNSSAEFHKLGLKHRMKALQALKAAPFIINDSQPYYVCLAAMLSLVTIDTMAGEDSDFPIHLHGCQQLQITNRRAGAFRNSDHQVDIIYRFLSLLASTTSSHTMARPWGPESFNKMPHFSSYERNIEHIYGITPTLGNLLYRTCQIAECIAYYHQRGERRPYGLVEACKSLGQDISNYPIDTESFLLIRPEEGNMLEVARYQARAFHGAVFIFYQRTVQTPENDDSLLIDMQRQVRSVWENLTLAENLKEAHWDGVKRAAPMSWPAFIASCEAKDRRPWKQWWERVQGYHLGNFKRQWRVIRNVWEAMDSDANLRSWRDALRWTGEKVLPI